jgi:hypothetical protein
MAKYTADCLVIASIWPGKLEPKTMYHGLDQDPRSGRSTRYWIEPVKKGSRPPYKLLTISDSFESVPDLNELASENYHGRNAMTSKPVACEEIAENLVQFWAGHMVGIPPGAAPGIIILPKGREIPHDNDVNRMFQMQTMFAEFCFTQGERLAAERDWKGITETMRVMAKWLGHARPWNSPEMVNEAADCPACKQPIPKEAFVCHHCGTKIKALPPELAALNPEPNVAAPAV